MNKFTYYILTIATTLLFVACSPQEEASSNRIIVTIQPLKYLVEQITGDDFVVDVLVPASASPETFEPTPKQFIALNKAPLVFSTGLIDFEVSLTERINKAGLINLSHGIELMAGSCSHNHAAAHHCTHDGCQHTHSAHNHGIDPHIWTSPRELKIMAKNAYDAIIREYPDSVKYTASYETLHAKLDTLDSVCAEMCNAASTKAFVVYHPALTYLARAYGLEQISVENDGKEPSAKHLATIIEQAKTKAVTSLLYQAQYPRSAVEIIAKDMGVKCYEFDPLAEDITETIHFATRIITGNNIE